MDASGDPARHTVPRRRYCRPAQTLPRRASGGHIGTRDASTRAGQRRIVAFPAHGTFIAFDAAAATVTIALDNGTPVWFVVDDHTFSIDATGEARPLLRSAGEGLTRGARVQIQWTTTSRDRLLAQRVNAQRQR